jgi:hypothetical protein
MSPKKTLIAIGDRRIIDDTRMSIERPRIPDWNLHIRQLEFYDRGMYTCSLNTKPMSTKNVYLEVYGKKVVNCWNIKYETKIAIKSNIAELFFPSHNQLL